MAIMDARVWRYPGIRSHSLKNTAIDANSFSDDGLDFPPHLHPVRELVTLSIFVSGILALAVWGGLKLLQVIF